VTALSATLLGLVYVLDKVKHRIITHMRAYKIAGKQT